MSDDPYEGVEEGRRQYLDVLGNGHGDDPWQVLLMVNVAMGYLTKGKRLPENISAMPPGWQAHFRAFEAKLDEAGLLK